MFLTTRFLTSIAVLGWLAHWVATTFVGQWFGLLVAVNWATVLLFILGLALTRR